MSQFQAPGGPQAQTMNAAFLPSSRRLQEVPSSEKMMNTTGTSFFKSKDQTSNYQNGSSSRRQRLTNLDDSNSVAGSKELPYFTTNIEETTTFGKLGAQG